MMTTGSKLFYGIAGLAFVAAILYGIATNTAEAGTVATLTGNGALSAILGPLTFGYKGGVGDHLGYSLLMGFAGLNLAFGIGHSVFRDSDAEATAEVTTGPFPVRSGIAVHPSYWPAATGGVVGLLVVGLATSPAIFMLGVAGAAVCAFEWTASVWSEQATGDPEVNRLVRNRLLRPIEIPVGAVLVIGIIVICLSRVLLALPETAGAGLAVGLAALVLVGAFWLAGRKRLSGSVMAVVLLVLVTAIIAGGIGGAIAGEREVEKHQSHEEGLRLDDRFASLTDSVSR